MSRRNFEEAAMSLDEILQRYRRLDGWKEFEGKAMTRFIESVAGLLTSYELYLNMSHYTLGISTMSTYEEQLEHPFVTVHLGGARFIVTYSESWTDGSLIRRREEAVLCCLADARSALAEMIGRLKPVPRGS